jgi:hypothetical protein
MNEMRSYAREYLDGYEDAINQILDIVDKYVNEDIFLKIQKEVRSTLLN